MHIKQFSGAEEQLAITCLCLDTSVLAKVAGKIPQGAFSSRWANTVAGWCLNHFKEFHEAPGAVAITAIYSQWAESADEATGALVGKFLAGLSPVEVSTDYAVELIGSLVSKAAIKQIIEKSQAALSNGNHQAAWDLVQAAKPPQLSQDQCYIDPINDTSSIEEAYDKANYEPLIRFPEGTAISRWLGPTLHRDALVVLCGADKAGKSSHLACLCQRGLVQGKRIAFFNLGDLSMDQMLKRWSTAIVGRPAFACNYKIPTDLKYKDKEFSLNYQERASSSAYSKDEAVAAWQKLRDPSGESRLRMVTKPVGSLTVEDIHAALTTWANQGWTADIIGLDYAALLASSRGLDKRHEALDHIWARLRAISTEFKALVLTASQVNADAYQGTSYWLNQSHFSGSKGIWSHCNAAIGLNITATERDQQVTRMNWIVLREREYLSGLPSSYLAVAGTPAIGRFHLISEFI
jgi:hypothetical protein